MTGLGLSVAACRGAKNFSLHARRVKEFVLVPPEYWTKPKKLIFLGCYIGLRPYTALCHGAPRGDCLYLGPTEYRSKAIFGDMTGAYAHTALCDRAPNFGVPAHRVREGICHPEYWPRSFFKMPQGPTSALCSMPRGTNFRFACKRGKGWYNYHNPNKAPLLWETRSHICS